MNRYEKYNRPYPCCNTCKSEDEPIVRGGLAYTPSDMARLAAKGMPINSLNMQSSYFDGESSPSFDIGSERERHTDVADLWEQHQNIIHRAREARKAAKLAQSKQG